MIDLRIVNDFPDDKKTAILENLADCVRQSDCTLDPVAKTKLFCQTHCSSADGDDPARPPNHFHKLAAVVRRNLLLKQWSARVFERRVADHYPRIGIRRSRIIHTLHSRCKSRVLWLRSGDVHRGPDSYEREKFWRCFAVQSDATVCAWSRMDKALMETVGRSEFAPITHRISNITASTTTSRRNYAIALHAEPVRPRTFVLLFGIDLEISFWRRFRRSPDGTRHSHQATVALHYINIFFRKRNEHPHSRGVVRAICSYVVWPAPGHTPCLTTSQ